MKQPAVYILVSLIALAALLLQSGGFTAWWVWDREQIQAGEYWRLYSGHWVHLGYWHLVLNVCGLGLLALLMAGVMRLGDWLAAVICLPLLISAGFWWLLPALGRYVGMSGVLHGVAMTGALLMLADRRERVWGAVFLGLLLSKLAAEQFADTHLVSGLIGGPVLTEAHLYGAVSGLLLGALLAVRAVFRPAPPATKYLP